MRNPELIRLDRVSLTYVSGETRFQALTDVQLSVGAGEHLAIVGPSGSGKSSLLHMIAGIDRPSEGEVVIGGTPIHTLPESPLARWRGKTVGIVFQFFQLIPHLSILQNLLLAMEFVDVVPRQDRRPRAKSLLQEVGIATHADKFPAELSGGEQQRAAIARALANDPPLLVADEPTGNLDSRSADLILGILRNLADAGKTVLVVTHERNVGSLFGRVVTLRDGSITSDERSRS